MTATDFTMESSACTTFEASLTKQRLLTDVLRQFGTAKLTVAGGSMLPALWPGDVVTLESHPESELRQGQIVSYRRGGLLVTHRVHAVLRDHIITRGDAAPHCDPPVSVSSIVGQVSWIERDGRRIAPTHSCRQQIASWFLQRSAFCTRVMLFLHCRIAGKIGFQTQS